MRPDTTTLALGLAYRQIGTLHGAGSTLWALWHLWRHTADPAAVCGTGAFLSFAFFMLTTQVHENWSFALFAPLAAAAALRPRYRALYAALSLTFLANLVLRDPPLRDLLGRGFDGTARTLGLLNAAAQCGLFALWIWRLRRAKSPHRPSNVWRSQLCLSSKLRGDRYQIGMGVAGMTLRPPW